MLVRADLKCYACGHVSGQIEGEENMPISQGKIYATSPLGLPKRRPDGRLTCVRCGGPLYLDDVTYIHPRPVRSFGVSGSVTQRPVAKAS
ncbi:MAG: hypothetical protein M1296_00915 [Chloroflexi bacterium]|nr:hypothetical protein [Chloroflexota bacterium]